MLYTITFTPTCPRLGNAVYHVDGLIEKYWVLLRLGMLTTEVFGDFYTRSDDKDEDVIHVFLNDGHKHIYSFSVEETPKADGFSYAN